MASERKRKNWRDWVERPGNKEKAAEASRRYRARPEVRERMLAYQAEYRKRTGSNYQWVLKTKYGLTPEDYARLQEEKIGCYICGGNNGENKRLAVDHDHTTQKVRGLLCDRCNQGIGIFRDDPALLLEAALYLEGTGG